MKNLRREVAMIDAPGGVRRVQPADRAATLDTIVRAFRTDPLLRWFFGGDDASWAEQARVFFGALIDVRLAGGEAWLAADGGAVALWDLPGGCLLPESVTGPFWASVWAELGKEAQSRVDAYAWAVEPLTPPEPRWYLGVLATRPDLQGRGLGSRVVRPVLDAADRAGLPAFLETASAQNVRFYATLGFGIRAKTSAGPGAPDVWVLEKQVHEGT